MDTNKLTTCTYHLKPIQLYTTDTTAQSIENSALAKKQCVVRLRFFFDVYTHVCALVCVHMCVHECACVPVCACGRECVLEISVSILC